MVPYPRPPGLSDSIAGVSRGGACCSTSSTEPIKRNPFRGRVRIRRCPLPSSPIALRTAVIRLDSADSDTIRPPTHRFQQVVLADHAIAVLHQIDQQVEDLRLERDQCAAAPQFATVAIEAMIPKAELQARPP